MSKINQPAKSQVVKKAMRRKSLDITEAVVVAIGNEPGTKIESIDQKETYNGDPVVTVKFRVMDERRARK